MLESEKRREEQTLNIGEEKLSMPSSYNLFLVSPTEYDDKSHLDRFDFGSWNDTPVRTCTGAFQINFMFGLVSLGNSRLAAASSARRT